VTTDKDTIQAGSADQGIVDQDMMRASGLSPVVVGVSASSSLQRFTFIGWGETEGAGKT